MRTDTAGRMARRAAALVVALATLSFAPALAQQQIASAEDLRRLSIEELAQIKVTSVSKTEEPLNQAAAAVFVITQDAIRRSGANSLPEVLRLAPNLHVARLDANTYAISARGFNQSGGTANKLLVLIDGRAIYSPLFSGTFWDAHKVILDDIDRIEVISGPGGTLWGGNAVNGVINIITKDSIATRAWSIDARLGTLDRRLGLRGGRSIGANGSFRAYALGMTHGSLLRPNGDEAGDDWNHLQGGFRSDWRHDGAVFTLQGDVYRGTGIGLPAALRSGMIRGSNLSAAWKRTMGGGASLRVQVYADTARRLLVSGIDARVDQFAVETQHNLARRGRHSIVIGGGYRRTEDDFRRGPGTAFLSPARKSLVFANAFAQDSIALTSRLRLTAGTKLEHNTYTGLEVMPDVRLAWAPSNRTTLWTAVSRAVRIPSRFDTDLQNSGILAGGPDFHSEELIAYEAGYRGLLTPAFSLSVSAFYNVYDELRSVESIGATPFPLEVRNGMRGETKGVESWAALSIGERWRVSAGVALLEKDLRFEPGTRDFFGTGFAGNDPRTQWSVRSE
ncbi:MAG TPA: TonB-dependent receptor, partial [Thermoanaerobaculia bacterium]|nr:TonB-dependent receptor [Thermoanaerobaculia bacterium]